ncbi:hypothetical protein RhiirA5_484194 [Rhizophagus irregularis]|uniref:NAD(P)-binding protein n=1 Tax=Rhizophagus irregularis TaxID=588596 RepID=A0A2N0Q994_9GLOM|nr:hypothetical protein RhiirA5_484194 [Rhizophagus irregularis]
MPVKLNNYDLSKHVIILTGATDGIIVQNQIIKTKDNFELQFQVNHLAPFLLTLLLLDTMKKSVSAELPGKIALTSSEANKFGEIDFDNLNLEKGSYLNPFQAYGNTKLMNVLVTKELSRIVQNESAINVLYPVFSHENKETGKYYKDGVEEPNKVAYDQEVAKKLWDVSEKILKNHGMI